MRIINVENYGGRKAFKCVRSTRKQQRNDNLSFPFCIQNNQQVKSHVNTCVAISLCVTLFPPQESCYLQFFSRSLNISDQMAPIPSSECSVCCSHSCFAMKDWFTITTVFDLVKLGTGPRSCLSPFATSPFHYPPTCSLHNLLWDQGWPLGWSSEAAVQGTKILEASDAKMKKTIYFVSCALYLMWVTGSLYSLLFSFFYWRFVCFWCNSPQWTRVSSFTRFLDHTQWSTTVGRTPLDEWSARRRDLYLTTHSTHNKQTSMPLVGFEPTISAGKRLQTYALDCTATATSISIEGITVNFYRYVHLLRLLHVCQE